MAGAGLPLLNVLNEKQIDYFDALRAPPPSSCQDEVNGEHWYHKWGEVLMSVKRAYHSRNDPGCARSYRTQIKQLHTAWQEAVTIGCAHYIEELMQYGAIGGT